MSARGRGSVERLPSGRYQARMPDTTRLPGTYASEQEARAVLDAAIAALAAGMVAPKPKPSSVRSFATCGEKWLDERELAGGRDVPNDRSRWNQHIVAAPYYALPLKRITPAVCVEWRDSLRFARVRYPYDHPRNGQRISPETAQRAYALASAFAQDATDRGWLDANPFRLAGKAKRKQARTEEPWTFLPPAEQTALAKAAPEDERIIILATTYTGVRTSEAAWLRLTDLHLDAVDAEGRPAPYIEVHLSRGGKPRKNGKPYRQELIAQGAAQLARWLGRLSAYAPKNPHGLVFPHRDGSRRVAGKFFGECRKDGKRVSRWHEWLAAASITRRVRVYDLRHTCATSLLCGWWGRRYSMVEIQDHLGHLTPLATRRYAHLAKEAQQKAARETGGGVGGFELPTTLPRACGRASKTSAIPATSLVGPEGIEPSTYGLKERSDPEELRAVNPPVGSLVGRAARILVDAAERRCVLRDDAERLAREWLALSGVELASAVLTATDEDLALRVIELAAHVLRVLDVTRAVGGGRGAVR